MKAESNNTDTTAGPQTRPSRLYLAKLDVPPATILEHLLARFPQVDPHIWHGRVSRGLVTLSDGSTLRADSPYRHGITVFYRKEVPSEPPPAEEARIVHQDQDILVADKPHGMTVTPAGDQVERSLIVRLQKSLGCDTLAPMHRLDRETAGLLLLTIGESVRGHYHRLFAERLIRREYLAVARLSDPPQQTRWRVENRLQAGEPWYRQRIVDGPANAVSDIELIEARGGLGLFRLVPLSGRKHQLRLHMASIGFPIVGDPFYPQIRERRSADPPLQLLAHRLEFIDPLCGTPRRFVSGRRLLSFDAM